MFKSLGTGQISIH